MTDNKEIYDDVLLCFCKHDTDIMYGYRPFPSTAISASLKITRYKAQKEIKRLIGLGIIESAIETEYDDNSSMNCILRGYVITDKARKTLEYKKAWAEERKICSECFGIDIGALSRKEAQLGLG